MMKKVMSDEFGTANPLGAALSVWCRGVPLSCIDRDLAIGLCDPCSMCVCVNKLSDNNNGANFIITTNVVTPTTINNSHLIVRGNDI